MTAAKTRPASRKEKRRRMKQMEGLLLVSRTDTTLTADGEKPRVIKPKKVHVMLQPQQLMLAYSAQEDQEMKELLGRVDLQGAQLEQTLDGFVIHGDAPGKKFKLHDNDKATIDAWFLAVYTAITEFARTPIEASRADMSSWMFSGVLSASHRDESTDAVEYELTCQLVIPSRGLDEPSIRWKVWRTAHQIQSFDDELHRIPSAAALLRDVVFPRDRKRDSLFGGLRRKSVQELKVQQLAIYIGRVFSVRQLSTDPEASVAIRRFLRFDSFFELSCERPVENNTVIAEAPVVPEQEQFEVPADPAAELFSGNNQSYETSQRESEPSAVTEAPVSAMQPRLSRAASVHFDDTFDEISTIEPEMDPLAAKKLHKQVIRTVKDFFAGDEDRVRDFQDQTKDFGRGMTEAKEYCAFLYGALGSKLCCELIPMMARLLPDEEKRQALLEARTLIIRKALRRNRRRSKQFSESVVMQEQQKQYRQANEQQDWVSAPPARTRPKSDSLSVLMSQSSVGGSSYGLQRSSFAEPRRVSMVEESSSSQRGSFVGFDDNSRRSLPDARRKLESRQSISMFGETIQDKTIEEENSVRESEDGSEGPQNEVVDRDEKRLEAPSPEMKSLPPVFRRVNSNSWLQQPRSTPHSNQPAYGHRASLPREPPRSVDPSGVPAYDDSGDAEQPPADDVEENPVLARLRKQGAVNFMLR